MKLPDTLPPERFIGLMSGTSVDGIDACGVQLWVEGGQLQFEIEATHSEEYPVALRQALLEVMSSQKASFETLLKLDLAVGHCFGHVAKNLMRQKNWTAEDITALGSHGQTIFHWPPPAHWGDEVTWLPVSIHRTQQIGGTWQIGCPEVITEATGVTTVADFRPKDMAIGGQGAPLVCLTDVLLFQNQTLLSCIQNIGGIGNVTLVPPLGSDILPIAFDTGPGNMLMDLACSMFFQEPFDAEGQHAQAGAINPAILTKLMQEPYLKEKPPKTTGREKFGDLFWTQLQKNNPDVVPNDWLATLNAFTAETIVEAYEQFVLPRFINKEILMIVGGGGAKNPVLMENMRQGFLKRQRRVEIKTHQDFGIPNQYKEALAFAILAWATCHQIPGNVPTCTGASRPAVLGKIIYAG